MHTSASSCDFRPLDTPGFFDSFSIVSSFLSQISDVIFSTTDETANSTAITNAKVRHEEETSEPCPLLLGKPGCST